MMVGGIVNCFNVVVIFSLLSLGILILSSMILGCNCL